jgi:hypothetical protein
MPGEDIYSWSPSATLNGSSDTLINWAEGQPRASVNNSSRSQMAAHAKFRDLQNGSIVTSGTADAQTFFSGNSYTTVPTGMRVLLKIGPSLTNTAAATLNMDNIGAVAIKYPDGGELGGSALKADSYAEFLYDGTNWVMVTIPASTITNITINQTIISTSTTAVEFTEGFDGSYDGLTILITNLVPTNDAVELWLRVSTDAGATWKAAVNDYRWVKDVLFDAVEPPLWGGSTSTAYGNSPVGDRAIRLTGPWMSNLTDRAVAGEVKIFAPHLASINMIQWHLSFKDSATFTDLYRGSGGYRLAGPVNGIKFEASAGSIASGKFTMYGVRGA